MITVAVKCNDKVMITVVMKCNDNILITASVSDIVTVNLMIF